MPKYITSKYIFDGKQLLEGYALLINVNGSCSLVSTDMLTKEQLNTCIYCGEGVISPGFIDLQLNGCGGVSFNEDLEIKTLEIMYQTCLNYATTKFLPTLITSPWQDVIQALDIVKDWFEKYATKRGVIGIHLEGPFISKQKKGIHQAQYIITPTDALLEIIVKYRQYFPIKLTIAPEVFSSKQITYLIKNHIVLAIGHSNASFEQASRAIDLGVRCATHTFNAMTGLIGREPGVVGALLNNENIYLGLIADLHHVDKANINLLYKLKKQHLYLVTDTVTAMGTNMQQFRFSGTNIFVKDGKYLDAKGTLAGANLNLIMALQNCLSIGLPLLDSLKMLTTNPSHALNMLELYGLNSIDELIYLDLSNFSTSSLIDLLA